MSSTILELIRQNQQDIEYCEKAIVKALFFKAENPRNTILADFIIKSLIDEIQEKSTQTLLLFQDSDGRKKEEVQFLEGSSGGKEATGNRSLDVWINYYQRLKDVYDYHEKFTPYGAPADIHDENWYFLHSLDDKSKLPMFSGQEGYGKFIDLHENYLAFINLKQIRKHCPYLIDQDYVSYLSSFDQFNEIPLKCKDKKFKSYLQQLADYLEGFFKRTQPLFTTSQFRNQHDKDFEYRWKKRDIRGWESVPKNLLKNPLFCGPCQHLFTNENTYKYHKNGLKHKKALKNMGDQEKFEVTNFKEIANLECYIARLRESLGDTIDDTINNIRKRQTRTAQELWNEIYESDDDEVFKLPMEQIKRKAEKKQMNESSQSEDEEKVYYNPLNLPIGWDGKPIPYWIYRYYGLNKEFKCEICGNYSYWGRRAFERHFSEYRHAYGMRCLRIPNTQHFAEITSIQEAIDLHQKLIQDQQSELFHPDFEEEVEDEYGNVITKRRIEDYS